MSETATLISGANTQNVELPKGRTTSVNELLSQFATMMNLPENERQVLLNGVPTDGNDPVRAGDDVEVVHRAGRKG